MKVKIFAISIPRFQDRHRHIVAELKRKTSLPWEVVGIDAAELRARADAEGWQHAPHLRDSEVGCAASHVDACRRVVDEELDCALIVEDDVIIPHNIDEIVEELRGNIGKGEVISLYNRTMMKEKFSSVEMQRVKDMHLIYPMETRVMRTAAAYFIERAAARKIFGMNWPVQFVADNWAAYYQAGAIDSIRLLHPIPVKLHPFQSTLGFDRGGGARRFLKRFASGLPFGPAFREARRRMIEARRERNLVLVDLPSDQLRAANVA